MLLPLAAAASHVARDGAHVDPSSPPPPPALARLEALARGAWLQPEPRRDPKTRPRVAPLCRIRPSEHPATTTTAGTARTASPCLARRCCRPWSWRTSRSNGAASAGWRDSWTTRRLRSAGDQTRARQLPTRLGASGTARCASVSRPRTAPWWATPASRPPRSSRRIRFTRCGPSRSGSGCRRRPTSIRTVDPSPDGRARARASSAKGRATPSPSSCCIPCTRSSWTSPCSGRLGPGRSSRLRMDTSSPPGLPSTRRRRDLGASVRRNRGSRPGPSPRFIARHFLALDAPASLRPELAAAGAVTAAREPPGRPSAFCGPSLPPPTQTHVELVECACPTTRPCARARELRAAVALEAGHHTGDVRHAKARRGTGVGRRD